MKLIIGTSFLVSRSSAVYNAGVRSAPLEVSERSITYFDKMISSLASFPWTNFINFICCCQKSEFEFRPMLFNLHPEM
jgi:hypothetical protein